MKHTLKQWFEATRYWSFPVSAMPVIVTFAYLLSEGRLPGGFTPYAVLIISLLGVILLHSAGNLLSDWADYRSGVDNESAFAVPNLVFHKFEPKEYLYLSIVLFIAGVAAGIAAFLLSGPGLLIIAGIGLLLTLCYSWLKYHALGDLDIFLVFGILIVMGAAYAFTGTFVPEALVISLPLGIVTVSVLHANNTLDTETDRKAGIKTFAMLIGLKASAILYCIYMILPFLCVIASVVIGWLHPMSLLCILAVIPACQNLRKALLYKEKGAEAMLEMDKASAQLQLMFSGLLALGLIISSLI